MSRPGQSKNHEYPSKKDECDIKVELHRLSRMYKASCIALRVKEEEARAEVDGFMEYCAKRWQTKEGTYQLKRRRLLPDVRDPPEQDDGVVDMKDI